MKILSRMATAALFALIPLSPAWAADRALVVGIERYGDPRVNPTGGAADDARTMAALIKREYAFPDSAVKMLINEDATAERIQKTFHEWLIKGTSAGDRVFFSYAGHGSRLPAADGGAGGAGDGMDDTLAPYDVNPATGANEIRGRVFASYIAQLLGRRVILVFDSCHSGTMYRSLEKATESTSRELGPRYLPSPKEFNALLPSGTRGLTDGGYGVEPVAPGARDLFRDDGFLPQSAVRQLSGVVVIAAAGDLEQAYPVQVEGGLRGALSYELDQAARRRAISPRDLRFQLETRLAEMQKTGKLKGSQRPAVKVLGEPALEAAPLFGSWEEVPAVALHNPLSRIRVGITLANGKKLFRFGDTMAFDVTTDTPGYLYLLVFSAQNVATVLYPNECRLDNQVKAGKVVIPAPGSGCEIVAGEPAGRDVAVALVSTKRLRLGEKDKYTWNEVFDRVELKELEKFMRESTAEGRGWNVRVIGQGDGAAPPEWQAVAAVMETRP